ncbi:helix-turn-helix transcriptional regulator [Mycetocola miduiensis]|nr:helix-turn-helix transcriptional regulator [Mycetocola miduiensis]
MMQPLQLARSQWLDVITDALGGFGGAFPWDPVCRQLGTQLDAPVTGKFQWDAHGHGSVMAYPFPDWFDLRDVAGRAATVHPLARYYSAHSTTEPLSTAQVSFSGADERTYEAELRACQIENHVWIPVERGSAGVLVVGVCRPVEPFDERSSELAGLAQGVIVALHHHWQVLDDWVAGHPVATGAYAAADEARLTPRQVVVLSLVAQGLTSQAISWRLHISPRTVERHLQNIYTRLGVSDRISAVRLATLAGVVAASSGDGPGG